MGDNQSTQRSPRYYNRDGGGYNKESSGYNRDNANYNRDTNYNKDNYNRDGGGFNRDSDFPALEPQDTRQQPPPRFAQRARGGWAQGQGVPSRGRGRGRGGPPKQWVNANQNESYNTR